MGNYVSRVLDRHAYQAGAGPRLVTQHAITASVQGPSGPSILPVSGGVTTIAADGAPFYNSGYSFGYPARPLGAQAMPLLLPPRAAQLDLTDPTSWDRPVTWCGVS